MLNDAAWHARLSRVFSGALDVWGVAASVRPAPGGAGGFVIAPGSGPAVQVRRLTTTGWIVARCDLVSGTTIEIGRHAGLPGVLRQLREELAPDAPAGRLVIGAQHLHLDADAP